MQSTFYPTSTVTRWEKPQKASCQLCARWILRHWGEDWLPGTLSMYLTLPSALFLPYFGQIPESRGRIQMCPSVRCKVVGYHWRYNTCTFLSIANSIQSASQVSLTLFTHTHLLLKAYSNLLLLLLLLHQLLSRFQKLLYSANSMQEEFNSAFRVSYLIWDLVSSNLKTCHFKVFLLYNKQIINRFLVSYNKTSKDYNFKHLKGHTGPFFNFTLWLWNLYSLKVPSEDLTSICALEVCISTPLPQTEGNMGWCALTFHF